MSSPGPSLVSQPAAPLLKMAQLVWLRSRAPINLRSCIKSVISPKASAPRRRRCQPVGMARAARKTELTSGKTNIAKSNLSMMKMWNIAAKVPSLDAEISFIKTMGGQVLVDEVLRFDDQDFR